MKPLRGPGYRELTLLTLINLTLVVSTLSSIQVTLTQPQATSPVTNMRSDSQSQECVKEVDDTLAPKCRIIFREEGGWPYTFNATCIKPNVFLVNHDRNISDKITRTSDQQLFASLYGEKPPPYARISCTAPFPVDFDYQGPGVLDFLRIWKSIKYNTINATESGTLYGFNAEILLTPEATGKYLIHSIEHPEFQTSFFIFSSKPEAPYLLGRELETLEALPSSESTSETVIPCITSNYNVTVSLFKRAASGTSWILYNGMKRYDPVQGFILPSTSASPGDVFKCTTGLENDSDSVTVTVPVHTTSGTTEKASNLRIEISESGGPAVCYYSNGQPATDLKFYNVFARNPTEAHLVAKCLQRGRPNCGGHTYHERKDGRSATGSSCINATSCSLISATHKEGLFVCTSGRGDDFVSTEYFTGLDKKIYKDATLAPHNVLIRPTFTPAISFMTGTKYEFKCESVGMIFVKDPYVLSVQYKNGTVQRLGELVWYLSGKDFFLTPDMDQVICSDQLWTTHEFLNSSLKVNVTEKKCDHDQWTCGNGQCIRDSWRCDGDKDCTDESDEVGCLTHVCKSGHFKCLSGQCINNEKLCNNKRECPDGTDEMAATCWNKTCSGDDFKCAAGQCIPAHFLCDGDKDCFDESDEAASSCSNYYPQISGNENVIFTENSINELVCETNALPAKLAPRMEWWFQDKNITDETRLWRGLSGNKLALRFVNISAADQGVYTCFAQNMLTRAEKKFTVVVQQHDVSCKSSLARTECLRRGCAYNSNLKSCYDYVDFVEPSATTASQPHPVTGSTTLRTVVIGGGSTAKPTDRPVKNEPEFIDHAHDHEVIQETHYEEESGHGLKITFGVLLFLVVCVLGAGIGWRYYTRRYVPAGSARMREDDQVTLNGI